MKQVRCAICETFDNYDVIYPPNFREDLIDERIFSARRRPDRLHFRIVKCRGCSLVYSNPVIDNEKLELFYRHSKFTYDDYIYYIKKTYEYYLTRAANLVKRDNFLEIGCGPGFLLQVALEIGFKWVCGVEPSSDAITRASDKIRDRIKNDSFRAGLYEENSFDLVAFFQTLDHIPDPNLFLKDVFRVLKPGGIVLALNHDVEALSATILGERSPIIDIEHTFLYNKRTMRQIFEKHGFRIVELESAFNVYPIGLWLRMLPIPRGLDSIICDFFFGVGLGRIPLGINAGNIYLIGQRP